MDLPADLPSLPHGWCYSPLASLVDQRGISYGVVQPGQADGDGVPIIRVNNIKNGRITTDEVFRVKRDVAEKHSRTKLRGGEVLLTLVGSLGECAVTPMDLAGWNVARAVGVIPLKPGLEAEWIAYCLRSPTLQRYIRDWATTTEESCTLTALRDALLPKLLSGEIRVKQAEKIVSEAV